MFNDAYIINNQQAAAKVGGIFDSIIKGINAGLSIFGQLGGAFGGGSGGGANAPAKGLQQITQRTNEILAALDALIAQIGQQPYEQIAQTAQKFVAALSDPTIIYQAQRGDDAAVLQRAKATAQQKYQQIVAAAGTPLANAGNQAGQIITSGGNAITSGLDSFANNQMLYIGGGALLAYLLLKKK